MERKLNPSSVSLPPGYHIEVFRTGLTTPISFSILDDGSIYVGDAGILDGDGKLFQLTKDGYRLIANGFIPPLTGVTYHEGMFYVTHKGKITRVSLSGEKTDLIVGLPSYGDHQNNRVEFGSDGKMYFGQGTATNSGVVGKDNMGWVLKCPYFHDYPGDFIVLNGKNFESLNFMTSIQNDRTSTGAYSPFGTLSYPDEIIKPINRVSGSILRANSDGTNIELVAWGLRNPFVTKFDRHNHLYASNNGMDVRGSRPVAQAPDEFQLINEKTWYGWPDYTGGLPVTLPQFKPINKEQPSFLLKNHPMTPPQPFATFTPHSAVTGFVFSYNPAFGFIDDVFITEFGSEAPITTGGKMIPNVGHKVSRIDMNTHEVHPFAVNKSGYYASFDDSGGLERPVDVSFGIDGALYVLDFGLQNQERQDEEPYYPNTGVIWRITKD